MLVVKHWSSSTRLDRDWTANPLQSPILQQPDIYEGDSDTGWWSVSPRSPDDLALSLLLLHMASDPGCVIPRSKLLEYPNDFIIRRNALISGSRFPPSAFSTAADVVVSATHDLRRFPGGKVARSDDVASSAKSVSDAALPLTGTEPLPYDSTEFRTRSWPSHCVWRSPSWTLRR